MLFGHVAQAKVLLIYGGTAGTEGAAFAGGDARHQAERNRRVVSQIIASTGGTYRQVSKFQVKTEWARTGRMGFNYGTAGAYAEQFDAVVDLVRASSAAGQTRVDSLGSLLRQGGSAASGGNAVPILRILDNAGLVITGGNAGLGVITTDSAGVAAEKDQGPGKAFYMVGDRNAALTHAYVSGFIDGYDTGDKRGIIYAGTPAYEAKHSLQESGGPVGCIQCDSLGTYAANDTLILWDRQFNTRLGQASVMSYLSAYGGGCAADSAINAGTAVPGCPGTEGDFALILAGLAHLDSLTRATGAGKMVLGEKVIKIAPVIYGGLSRGTRASWDWNKTQGINDADTSAFYAFLDSLATRPDIKVTFAVNVDSAAEYSRDIIKMKSVTTARFTPQVWNGATPVDTLRTDGGYNRYPIDVFGRYRKRAALGDSLNHSLIVSADSSVAWLAKRSLFMCDSIFVGRTSRIAVAPADDWSPYRLTGGRQASLNTSGLTIDSVMYALQMAGYQGVVADAQDPDANASKIHGPSSTNPRGWYNRQQLYSSASIPGLRNFKILTHTGFPLSGGTRQASQGRDSTGAIGGWYGHVYVGIARVWSGALLDMDDSYDTWAYDDTSDPTDINLRSFWDVHDRKVDHTLPGTRRGNIVRLSCADFSGKPNGPPAGVGWHVLKSVANAMYMINKLAGRTVVQFTYPEDIDP